MPHNTKTDRKVHEGRNVNPDAYRDEMLGIKQDALAVELGRACPEYAEGIWNQQEIFLPNKISAALKIPVEAIQNFDEEQAVNIISNTFTSNDTSTLNAVNIQPTFNPIDKMIELYERMLQQQKEMIEKLERLIEKK